MNACPAYESLLAAALFGDLGPNDRERLAAHLETCPGCQETLRDMEATLQWTASGVRPEPEPAFWDGYYARLDARMMQEARRRDWVGRLTEWLQQPGRLNVTALVPAPRWALQVAGALALIAVGILIGWFVFRAGTPAGPRLADEPSAVPEEAPSPPVAEAPAVVPMPDSSDEPVGVPAPRRADRRAVAPAPTFRTASLDARTNRYLERSKVLLLGLVHLEPEGAAAAGGNLERKQEVARELVQEAGGLKEELNAADQRRLHELIDDLEVILLQIANMESDYDLPAIELVKSGVERRGILLKINLTEMQQADQGLPPETRSSVLPDSSTL